MNNKLPLFAIISFLLLLFSCKQNVPQLALYVPKDAASVFIVDAKAITDKISSSGITLDSLANMLNKNKNGLQWNDIQNSGIDLTKSFFIFNRQNNSMQAGKSASFGLIAEVADKNKLEAFFRKQVSGATAKQDSKYKYVDLGKGNVAGWNDKVLIISGVVTGSDNDEASSHQQLTALFTQTESNSVASVKEFKDALNKPGDIHFWSNASGNLSALPMIGMTKLGTLFENTYTDGTINFENGKAVATAETHYNKTLSDILSKYPSKGIDKSIISRYPQPINGFGIVAFNPKVLLDMLHYLGFDAAADNYMSQMGFTATDLVNAFKGDIAVIFSDFKMEDHAVPYAPGVNSKKPGGEFLVNMVIGDKAAFDKVMTGLVNKNILSKNGDQYQLGFFGGHGFVIETTNNNLLIASDDALVKAYEAGNSKPGLPNDVEKEIDDKSMAMYVDIASMLQKTNSSDTAGIKTMQAAKATFKNFIASADKSDGKSMNANLELNMMNTNENSLASLVKFMAVAHEEEMKKPHIPSSIFMDSIPAMKDENESENDSEQNNQ